MDFADPNGAPVASITSFNGHPSTRRADNRKISGDYPGALQRIIESNAGGLSMFAAGPVGSMTIRGNGGSLPWEQLLNELGPAVTGFHSWTYPKPWTSPGSNLIVPALPLEHGSMYLPGDRGLYYLEFRPKMVALATAIVQVDLPPLQYPLGTKLRLSPIATRYLHSRKTYVHVLRMGNTVLLGMPCDYSGELAAELDAWMAPMTGKFRNQTAIITSFNGDYIGYLTPQRRWEKAGYETRDMSVFGPWCGEYFNEIARRIMMKADERQRPVSTATDKSSNPSSN